MDSTDLVNDVLLKEEQARRKGQLTFPNRRARRGWLMTALRNLVISEARRQRPLTWDDAHGSLPGSEPTGSEVLRENEDARNARGLLDVLPERDRAVVELRVVEGQSFAEVGERLGIPEGSARVIFHRSLKRLRTKNDGGAAER